MIEFYFDQEDYLKKSPDGEGLQLEPKNKVTRVGDIEIKKEAVNTTEEPWYCNSIIQ